MASVTDPSRRPVYIDRINNRLLAEPVGGGPWPVVTVEVTGDGPITPAGGTMEGELRFIGAGALVFEGAIDDSFETKLLAREPAGQDNFIYFPNTSGDVVTTGDTGTVTSTMIANGTIVNADIATSAAIADTKLATISTAGKVSGSAITSGNIATTGNFSTTGSLSALSGITVGGELLVSATGSLVFEGVSVNDFETTLAVVDPTADRVITLPDVTGTVVTTGDTGTVTSAMILDGTIVNADIAANAAIADSKLGTISTAGKVSGTAITSGDINTSGNITTSGAVTAGSITTAGTLTFNGDLGIGTGGSIIFEGATNDDFETKLTVADPTADRTITLPNASGTLITTGDTGIITSSMILDGTITDADISASAGIADSKLATISTAGKVSGTAITSGNISTSGSFTTSGNITASNSAGTVSIAGQLYIGNTGSLVFEGSSNDSFKTTLAVTNPTASRTITLPNSTGTVPLLEAAQTWSGAQTFSAASVFNSTAGAIDFRVLGNTLSYLLFVQGSTDRVGINQSTPLARLDLNGNVCANVVAVAALDIDCSAGNYFTKTISANSTFTFSNAPASRAFSFTLELTHTSGTVTWPTAVKWPGDIAPSLTTGKTHLFMFVTDDGGARWRGASLVAYTN